MYSKLTQEEIAKQFALPERKSKIASLLKQDGVVYCICKSSDSSRFMIGCDLCEEWFHGDCIGITEKESKNIKLYYCDKCKREDRTLRIIYKTKATKTSDDNDVPFEAVLPKPRFKKEPQRPGAPRKKTGKQSEGCGDCVNCRRLLDCGSCRTCKDAKRYGSRRPREKCFGRICRKRTLKNENDSSSDDDLHRSMGSSVRAGMQCYGPGCTLQAMPNSKYCSSKCGVKLATTRIYHVLPQRLQEWSLTPSYAEESDKKFLESIRKKQENARAQLQLLDRQHEELERALERASHSIGIESDLDPKKGKRPKKKDEEESSIYCITCGHEIHTSSAIKHMEKCFNKYESQASFGSVYKTRIEGYNMFCDFYNVSSKTYCKRLRVLCPEHRKDPKVGANEVCGYPFMKNVFEETGNICCELKKNCLKHHSWDKLRRAEIDMDRVRQWLKIDELLEQERQIRHRMAQRAGVLPLMLHSTYDHEAMESMTATEEEERIANLEKNVLETYNRDQLRGSEG